jgi:hypothetical protein
MATIDALQQRYGRRALAAATILGLSAYLAGWPAVSRGLLLGSLFSVLNFVLLAKALVRQMSGEPRGGRLAHRITQVGRYLLWAVPVVLAVKFPAVDLAATVAGLFMVPASLLLDAFVLHLRGRKSSPT